MHVRDRLLTFRGPCLPDSRAEHRQSRSAVLQTAPKCPNLPQYEHIWLIAGQYIKLVWAARPGSSSGPPPIWLGKSVPSSAIADSSSSDMTGIGPTGFKFDAAIKGRSGGMNISSSSPSSDSSPSSSSSNPSTSSASYTPSSSSSALRGVSITRS